MALLFEFSQCRGVDIEMLFTYLNLKLLTMAPREVFLEVDEFAFQLPTVIATVVLDYHFERCESHSDWCPIGYEYEVLAIQDECFKRLDEISKNESGAEIEEKLLEILMLVASDSELYPKMFISEVSEECSVNEEEYEEQFDLDSLFGLNPGQIIPFFIDCFFRGSDEIEIRLYRVEEITELVQSIIELKNLLEE